MEHLFVPGAVVEHAGRRWRVDPALGADAVLLRGDDGPPAVADPARVTFPEEPLETIATRRSLNAVQCTEAAWAEAVRRRDLVLQLARQRDHNSAEVDAVAAELGLSKPVSAVEVVDPETVRLVLSQPYAPLVAVLSDRAGMMASPKAVEQLGKDFYKHPVCAGPFSFDQRVAQDHITLQRFPGYWNAGAIHLDRIVFRPIADSTVRLVDLRAGQLDLIEEVAPTDAESIQRDNRLKFAKATALGYEAIMLNLGNGPAANTPFGHDPRVRAALEAAIDRTALNQVATSGLFIPDN